MALESNNYTHLTANGVYPIASNQCGLETVKNNFADAGGTIKVTEGDSTQIIANKMDLTKVYKHDFDLANLNGLIVTISGGTAPDVTVVWQ
jgi:hypothetical protein